MTTTPSNTIARYDLNGNFQALIRDYSSSPGDTPVSLVGYDTNNILVLVENASGRRLELVAKDGSSVTTFLTNSTALSAQVRFLAATPDGGWLVSKSTAMEKFNSGKARVTSGANPFISAPAAPCATVNVLIPGAAYGPSNSIFMIHANASPNNKIVILNPAGYSVAGDCYASVAAPSANHYPTSILYHSSGKMLVSYGNTTGPVHQIYSYTATSNSMTSPVQAYNDSSTIQGISSMEELPDGNILVASVASTFNSIEELSFNSSTGILTRVGTSSFIAPSVFTRSTSSILVW